MGTLFNRINESIENSKTVSNTFYDSMGLQIYVEATSEGYYIIYADSSSESVSSSDSPINNLKKAKDKLKSIFSIIREKSDTKIISAFPGTGKSFFYNNNKRLCLDSDSSEFSWIVNKDGLKERNPDFPRNYIQHILYKMGKYDYIFVSSHKEVREALTSNGICFYLVYPNKSLKSEYIERYKQRGSPDSFIKLLENNFESWIDELKNYDAPCIKFELEKGDTISSWLENKK